MNDISLLDDAIQNEERLTPHTLVMETRRSIQKAKTAARNAERLAAQKLAREAREANATWNTTNIAELRVLWDEGHSTAEIGRRLNVSKNAVLGKSRTLDLPERPHRTGRNVKENLFLAGEAAPRLPISETKPSPPITHQPINWLDSQSAFFKGREDICKRTMRAAGRPAMIRCSNVAEVDVLCLQHHQHLVF